MSVPVISPTTAVAPATSGVAADVDAISQDFLNFAPVAAQTVAGIKAASTAPAVNGFHRFLNILLAADSATASVPDAEVQALGGLVGIVATVLNISTTSPSPASGTATAASAPSAEPAETTPAEQAHTNEAPAAVSASAMATAKAHITAGQRALEILTLGAVKPHPAVVAAQDAVNSAMAAMATVATQS